MGGKRGEAGMNLIENKICFSIAKTLVKYDSHGRLGKLLLSATKWQVQMVTFSSLLKSTAKFPLALMATRPLLNGSANRLLIAELENIHKRFSVELIYVIRQRFSSCLHNM